MRRAYFGARSGALSHERGCKRLRATSTFPTPSSPQADSKDTSRITLGLPGAGIFFWWQIGYCYGLHATKKVDFLKSRQTGASAGALASALIGTGTLESKGIIQICEVALELMDSYDAYKTPFGLVGIWGDIIREWLEILLPEDAAEIVEDRVQIVLLNPKELIKSRPHIVTEFSSKQDLISAATCSAHVPLLMDGKITNDFRGEKVVDGSMIEFFHDIEKIRRIWEEQGAFSPFDYWVDYYASEDALETGTSILGSGIVKVMQPQVKDAPLSSKENARKYLYNLVRKGIVAAIDDNNLSSRILDAFPDPSAEPTTALKT